MNNDFIGLGASGTGSALVVRESLVEGTAFAPSDPPMAGSGIRSQLEAHVEVHGSALVDNMSFGLLARWGTCEISQSALLGTVQDSQTFGDGVAVLGGDEPERFSVSGESAASLSEVLCMGNARTGALVSWAAIDLQRSVVTDNAVGVAVVHGDPATVDGATLVRDNALDVLTDENLPIPNGLMAVPDLPEIQ